MRPPKTSPTSRQLLAILLLSTACSVPDSASPARLPTEPAELRVDGTRVIQVAASTSSPLLTVGGVTVYKSGFGSGMAMVPGKTRELYLLTDRGPNIDGVTSSIKVFPDPSYAPRIYRASFSGPTLNIVGETILRRPDGVTPISGIPIPSGQCGSTLEVAQRLDGSVIPPDPYGLDPEGIVALGDGSFWVSDEYGPFIAHYDNSGRELERLSPCNGGLPEVYQLRRPNRGMEGLTISTDDRWLVGIMQAPLENPSSAGVRNVSRATRILFRNIRTGQTKELLYLLDNANLQGNSEILALSDTRYMVIERDGTFAFGTPAATLKRIYIIDITGATDISALGALGATPIGGTKTIEQATEAELLAAGIVPVTKVRGIDLVSMGYPHDKPEGLARSRDGYLFVVNDDDFGIVGSGGTLVQKVLPPSTTQPDYVSVWQLRQP